MRIEPLSSEHDRATFDCGEPELNDYLRRYARQNEDADLGRTFVLTEDGVSVLGYFTLAVGQLDRSVVPARRLPRYPVPVVVLARLAVDLSAQKQHLGERLLMAALCRASDASRDLGIYAVVVDAMTDRAREFYVRYGFQELLDNPRHLYISLRDIRALGLRKPDLSRE